MGFADAQKNDKAPTIFSTQKEMGTCWDQTITVGRKNQLAIL
jgi:hypothetical protein